MRYKMYVQIEYYFVLWVHASLRMSEMENNNKKEEKNDIRLRIISLKGSTL